MNKFLLYKPCSHSKQTIYAPKHCQNKFNPKLQHLPWIPPFTCWWFSFLPLLPNSIFFFPVSWWFLFAVVVALCVGNSRCFVVWWLCAISDLGCDGVLGFGRFGLWFGVVIWEKRENITDNDTFFWFNFNIWLMQPN